MMNVVDPEAMLTDTVAVLTVTETSHVVDQGAHKPNYSNQKLDSLTAFTVGSQMTQSQLCERQIEKRSYELNAPAESEYWHPVARNY
jgi:hypothetical protein